MAESTGVLTPPPPPRATGDAITDNKALIQWANDFYAKTVGGGYFLSAANQFDPGTFDPSQLPSPTSATVASAQNTANQAYGLASQALSRAAIAAGAIGEITISGLSTTGSVNFSQPQPNTNYIVLVSPVVAKTGTPAVGAFQVPEVAKTTSGFTLTLAAAPGAGNSVTYQYRVQAPSS